MKKKPLPRPKNQYTEFYKGRINLEEPVKYEAPQTYVKKKSRSRSRPKTPVLEKKRKSYVIHDPMGPF